MLAALDLRVTGLGLWQILALSNQNHEAAAPAEEGLLAESGLSGAIRAL